MAFPWDAALGLVGGLFSAKGARDQNKANLAIAREQMAFQERMSSTAHQREVADLRKAGLNPILSATGGPGASSPAGASAQMENVLGAGVSSALQSRLLREQLKNLETDRDAKKVGMTYTNHLSAKALMETNNIEIMNNMLQRDARLAELDQKIYEKAPILRILEKITGSAGFSARDLVRR